MMKWNDHSRLRDKHSFLSPSQSRWLRYSPEKLIQVWKSDQKKKEGTELHKLASDMINKGISAAHKKQTFYMFVNDCIKEHMSSEVVLYYSDNAFGTADAIKVENNSLFIYDLKTGTTEAHFDQLDVYAALYCLEYGEDPRNLQSINERLYQNNEVKTRIVDPNEIFDIMGIIVDFDRLIERQKASTSEFN